MACRHASMGSRHTLAGELSLLHSGAPPFHLLNSHSTALLHLTAPALTPGVTPALTPGVTPALTAALTPAVTAALTPAVAAQAVSQRLGCFQQQQPVPKQLGVVCRQRGWHTWLLQRTGLRHPGKFF